MATAGGWRRPAIGLLVIVIGLGFYLTRPDSPEAGKAHCAGKTATLVSNDRHVRGTRGPDVIVAGRGPNAIVGGRGNDVICAGGGRDRVDGGRGKDTIDGKAGADLVEGGRGSDDLRGGAGRDRVRGESGNDVVRGGPGARDDVDGGMGDDTVTGGSGSFDAIAGGIGRDRIEGGPGAHDTASYRSAGGPIEVELGRGRVRGAEDERLKGIENVLGGPGNERCFGLSLAVRWCGSTGIAISGSPGDDSLTIGIRDRRLVISAGSEPSLEVGGRRVGSLLVSLGAGDDRAMVAPSVPPGVQVTIEGGPGSDWLRGGRGGDTLYAGDDEVPDRLEGGAGGDALFGVNIFHPRHESGAATLIGGGGDDLLIGGQPCGGDLFAGGPGANDSVSFARVRNAGVFVAARIGGAVTDPDEAACMAGHIARGTEKIEGSPGPDVLLGNAGANTLLGRGGADRLDGRGGPDRCIGGRGRNRARHCEYLRN